MQTLLPASKKIHGYGTSTPKTLNSWVTLPQGACNVGKSDMEVRSPLHSLQFIKVYESFRTLRPIFNMDVAS